MFSNSPYKSQKHSIQACYQLWSEYKTVTGRTIQRRRKQLQLDCTCVGGVDGRTGGELSQPEKSLPTADEGNMLDIARNSHTQYFG